MPLLKNVFLIEGVPPIGRIYSPPNSRSFSSRVKIVLLPKRALNPYNQKAFSSTEPLQHSVCSSLSLATSPQSYLSTSLASEPPPQGHELNLESLLAP